MNINIPCYITAPREPEPAAEPCKEGRVYLTRLVDGRRETFAASEGSVCVTHGRNWPCAAAEGPSLHDAPAMSQDFHACPPETVPDQP